MKSTKLDNDFAIITKFLQENSLTMHVGKQTVFRLKLGKGKIGPVISTPLPSKAQIQALIEKIIEENKKPNIIQYEQ